MAPRGGGTKKDRAVRLVLSDGSGAKGAVAEVGLGEEEAASSDGPARLCVRGIRARASRRTNTEREAVAPRSVPRSEAPHMTISLSHASLSSQARRRRPSSARAVMSDDATVA